MAPLLKAAALTSALTASTIATPLDTAPLEKRITCPPIHVFGARETTAPPGYGSAGTFVNLILNAHAGATAEALVYPAAGGTNSHYAASVQAGTPDLANAVNAFNQQCPSTQLVLVGYSQVRHIHTPNHAQTNPATWGAQIIDNALCGGGDPNQGIIYTYPLISSNASNAIKTIIWAGDPRHTTGSPYNYGTSTAGGFDARPPGFSCPTYTLRIRSYCDAADPYCSNGNDPSMHQRYGAEYGSDALAFVNSKL